MNFSPDMLPCDLTNQVRFFLACLYYLIRILMVPFLQGVYTVLWIYPVQVERMLQNTGAIYTSTWSMFGIKHDQLELQLSLPL